MTTDATIKTGYYRTNPVTGVPEWIEGNYAPPVPREPVFDTNPLISPSEFRRFDEEWAAWTRAFNTTGLLPDAPEDPVLAPMFENFKTAVEGIQLESPAVEPVPIVTPEFPEQPEIAAEELAALAGTFGIDQVRFVGAEQLSDLALPPEERSMQWQIPYVQYLTWQQAQFLGFDVPEGSVVLMTPLAGGEPSFSLIESPDAIEEPDTSELLLAMRGAYPEWFDPKNSFGISPGDIPAAVISGFKENLARDYAGTVEGLFERAGMEQGENILRLIGVTEEHILLTLDATEQENRVNSIVDAVFPGFEITDLQAVVDDDWGLFVETIQTDGSSAEKRRLLEYMGYAPLEINNFFSVIRVVVPFDGVDTSVIVDVPSKRAFDREGNWIGSYNAITHEFEALPEETRAKDLWDSVRLAGQHMWQQSKEWVLSALPNLLFRDLTEFERNLYGDEWADEVNAANAKQRDAFRREYARAQAEFDQWIIAHPELAPPAWARGNFRERLREDPLMTILYEASGSVVFMIAAMGAGLAGTLVGGPAVGVLAATVVLTPSLAQDAYEELLRAGVPERDAAVWGNLVGVTQSLLESLGNLVPLKHMFPKAFGILRVEIIKGLAARIAARTVMAGKGALAIEVEEIITEVLQGVVMNAALKVFNENQDLFEGWDETALRTAVATLPLAIFGGVSASLQRVARADIDKLTEVERQEQGFEQDPQTGNWYRPMDIELPEGVEVATVLGDVAGTEIEITPEPIEAVPTEAVAEEVVPVPPIVEEVPPPPPPERPVDTGDLRENESADSRSAVEKLTDAVKVAEPVREETEALKSEELGQRVKAASRILESGEGMDAFRAATAPLRGALPTAQFTPPANALTENEITGLYNQIRDIELVKGKPIQFFDRLNTAEALGRVLSGNIPTRSQLQLLEAMFGSDLTKALLDKRSLGAKAWDTFLDAVNLPRAFITSWDLSAPLRQGAVLFWGQPRQSLGALGPMVKAFASEKFAIQVDEIIHSGRFAALRERSGLYIAPVEGVSVSLSEREEAFMSRLAEKIPLVKRSQQAYVTYLNKLRADVFDAYARDWEGLGRTEKDYKSLARFINIATGRGTLKSLGDLGPVLNAVFFSPRYQASRVQLPFEFFRATPAVRKVVARNIVSFVAANFTIMSLAVLAGATVEDDPRSSDFGKIKVGNTRIDLWAGFQPYARVIAQIITGIRKTTSTGRLDELSDSQRKEIMFDFVRGKLAPVPGLMVDILLGETMIGQELTLESEDLREQAFNRLVPLFLQDLIEAVLDSGIAGALLALPGGLGVGVQTYGGGYWSEMIDQLGKTIPSDALPYTIPPGLSNEPPPVYSTKTFYGDTIPRISGVAIEDMTDDKGFPPLSRAVAEARDIKVITSVLPNLQLSRINGDAARGDTFEQFHAQWKAVQAAAPDEERAALIAEFGSDYIKGNFGDKPNQILSLLRKLHALPDGEQAQFILDNPSLSVNPRRDWLQSHPEENAMLALFGQADVLTKTAYDEVLRLMDELDIPAIAVAPLTLPPETSVDNHFKRLQAVEDFGGSSAEAKLILAQDPDLLAWYQEEARRSGGDPLSEPEFPVGYYEIKVKNRAERERWADLGDKEHDDYIADPDEKRATFYREFPESEFFDDNRRTEAIANDFTDSEVEEWVERGRLVDSDSAGSPLVKQWAFDNPDAYRQALEEGLLEDRGGLATDEERGHYDQWVEPAVRLQAKNVEEDGYWSLLGDKTQPETYIDDEAKRRATFFEKFPDSEYFDDVERIEAYKEGFTEKEADLWAERGRLLGTVEPLSAEAKVWLVDHDSVWKKALEAELLTDDGSEWNIPALRLTVEWRTNFDEYEALTTDADRAAYKEANADFRLAWQERNGYKLKNASTGATLSPEHVALYVAYQELGSKGKRQERFLIDNPEYAEAIRAVTGIDIPKAEDVPAVQYDDIYDANRETFELIERYKDHESADFIEDPDERAAAVEALRFDEDGNHTDFGIDEIRRNGYGKKIPEQYIEDYVTIYTTNKPENWKLNTGTELWYEDDWFYMENQEYYKNVYLNNAYWAEPHQRKDFTKVPSREVFQDYLEYLEKGSAFTRDDYRRRHPELDAWLVKKFGYTPISEKDRRETMTPSERFQEEFSARQAAIEEELAGIRE